MLKKPDPCGCWLLVAALALGIAASSAQTEGAGGDVLRPPSQTEAGHLQAGSQAENPPHASSENAPGPPGDPSGFPRESSSPPTCNPEAPGDRAALSAQAQNLGKVIERFRSMGVGVAPFEQMLVQARSLLSEGRISQSQALLAHLNILLRDQQKNYYANKMQVWRSQQKNLIAARVGVRKHGGGNAAGTGSPGSSSGLSKAVNKVLTGAKGEYKPFIYPIAR